MNIVTLANGLCADRQCQLLYLIKSGAHAYGTVTPESDTDIRGVFLPPWKSLIGLSHMETLEAKPDIVLQSAQKFVRLAVKANPNILDWLFVPKECILYENYQFKRHIRGHREEYLSKEAYSRFKGYIFGHLQKMSRGRTRDLGAKRKATIEEHGYATKNAMHLVRLARTGYELFETGEYNVWREDAAELLAIRRGEWSQERVERECNYLLNHMAEASVRSELREHPPRGLIENDLINMTLEVKRW